MLTDEFIVGSIIIGGDLMWRFRRSMDANTGRRENVDPPRVSVGWEVLMLEILSRGWVAHLGDGVSGTGSIEMPSSFGWCSFESNAKTSVSFFCIVTELCCEISDRMTDEYS